MKQHLAIYLLVIAFLIGGITPMFSQSPEQLFQKGLVKEEGEGALNEAIDIYNKIVDNQDADKSLQAKALLHVGLCYEKLGKNEATKAYQQLVNNFPGQKNEVAIARERLTRLLPIPAKVAKIPQVMTNKKIWEGNEVDNLGKISPDGKYISYVDWPAGDLAIYEIATEKKRKLTSYNYGETWSTDPKTTYVLSSIWSADSRQNIYSTGTGEIRTIGLENSTPRTIRERETKNEWVVQVYDISGDGKTILGTIETMDKKTQIILFSVRDGEKQIIKELPGIRIVENLKFTNDGAGIVYDYPPDLDSPVHDIYWLSLDGKTETPIIKHPAHDFVLDLSPDGNQLLFASSRSGKMGFYYVGLKNGKTQGNPKFIKTSEYPNLTALGFSDNGVFYCFYQPFVNDVYETEINSETSAIVSHPNEIIGSFMGENSAPDYSSDGKYLAFISRRPPFFTRTNGIPTGNVLCVKSLENGTLREIKPEIEDFEIPKWSPDNRSILIMNWNAESITEIYKIDLQSEKLSLIFSDKNKKIFDFEWCADGMSIFMVLQYQENDTTKHKLVRYNLETKEEKILYVNHGRKGYFPDLATISCSPDGNWIAFLGLDQKKTIKIIPTSGGEVREIYSLDHKKTIDGKQIWSSKSYANLFIHHCWSADGKYIYLQKFREPRGDGIWNLWQVPVNGGNPVNLGLEMTDIWQISAHPNGRKLVYSNEGSSYKLPQVWKMENFLPDQKMAKSKEPEGIRISQISKKPYLDDLGTVSSDGKYLSCVDWGKGDLAIRNLSNGEKQLLMDNASLEEDPEKFVIGSAISKNGKLVAYSWWRPYHTFDLHIFDTEKNTSKLLFKEEGVEVYPSAWLSDEKLITIKQNENEETTQITLFNVSDGTFQNLKSLDKRQWAQLCTSPDEEYIAYNTIGGGNSDINVLTADGKFELPLVVHPANDKVIGWIPGRKDFLFTSDRSGTWDLWTLPVMNGKPVGEAKRLFTEFGDVAPIGITEKGECFFGFSRRNFNAYITSVDKTTGKPDKKPREVLAGSVFSNSWSPNGEYMACVKQKKSSFELILQDTNNGNERRLAKELAYVIGPYWSSNGNSVYIFGMDREMRQTKGYKGAIYTVDVETGDINENLQISEYKYTPSVDDALPISGHVVSDDNKYIYLLFQNDWIVKRNLANGTNTILYRHPGFVRGVLKLSPDGKKLLFAVHDKAKKQSRLITISVNGGDERELCTSQEAKISKSAFWSPNGKSVYFTESPKGTSLWRVNSEGGTPEKVWHTDKRAESFAMHPSGNEISYSVRERTTEIRVIEGLKQELEKIYRQNE